MSASDRSMTPSPLPRVVPGRAYTLEEKRAIVEALLITWIETTDMRLGQLLVCATTGADLFVREDQDLLDDILVFRNRMKR